MSGEGRKREEGRGKREEGLSRRHGGTEVRGEKR
jgi:hypothetical protein